mgnify:CR=1 FL=1
MDRIKTFAKYVILVVLFWVLSEVLINYAFNTKKEEEKVNLQEKNTQEIVQQENENKWVTTES